MAEGLFNAAAPSGWRAGSAGTEPAVRVRPEAVAVMQEIGVDISTQRPKRLNSVLGPDIALAIGLCEEEACPVVVGVRSDHWPLPDPAGRGIDAFRRVRDELRRRIAVLQARLTAGGEMERSPSSRP
jgi:arsenate reductase (thioredoxin)